MEEKKQYRLIGSSFSKEDLERAINEYFYSTSYIITDEGRVFNTKFNDFLENYRVIQKRNRWRFEREKTRS